MMTAPVTPVTMTPAVGAPYSLAAYQPIPMQQYLTSGDATYEQIAEDNMFYGMMAVQQHQMFMQAHQQMRPIMTPQQLPVSQAVTRPYQTPMAYSQQPSLPLPNPAWSQRTPAQMALQHYVDNRQPTRFSYSTQLTTSQANHLMTTQPTSRRNAISFVPHLASTPDYNYGTQSAR